MLLAVTPTRQCIGIKIFARPVSVTQSNLSEYIEQQLNIAIDIKRKIESGELCDFSQATYIVTELPTDIININDVIESHTKCTLAIFRQKKYFF